MMDEMQLRNRLEPVFNHRFGYTTAVARETDLTNIAQRLQQAGRIDNNWNIIEVNEGTEDMIEVNDDTDGEGVEPPTEPAVPRERDFEVHSMEDTTVTGSNTIQVSDDDIPLDVDGVDRQSSMEDNVDVGNDIMGTGIVEAELSPGHEHVGGRSDDIEELRVGQRVWRRTTRARRVDPYRRLDRR